jgi:hypothetical protein
MAEAAGGRRAPGVHLPMRHIVDLDTVRHELLGVTGSAFRPACVPVWIAPATARVQAVADGG